MDLRRPLALVSGGPDSVALLRVVVSLGGEPVVLHVDHGLRGEQSYEDAEFVSELCRQVERALRSAAARARRYLQPPGAGA